MKSTFYRILLSSVCILFLLTVGFRHIHTVVFAEQSSSSPESGTTSRIKTASDWLVAKGANYGATDAPDWSNNWGTMWNRIMEAAAWEPGGTAIVTDVLEGKTFYAGSSDRDNKTGSLVNYSSQSLEIYQDKDASDGTSEEPAWTNTATNVWKDSRTGVYWSNSLGSYTNSFTLLTCDFFTNNPRGSYAGGDADCGDAINTCSTFSLDATGDAVPETDWYLPSQKESFQAYIDGMYNQAGVVFTTSSIYWTSTEHSSSSTYAAEATFDVGQFGFVLKNTANHYVRCVR